MDTYNFEMLKFDSRGVYLSCEKRKEGSKEKEI